MFWSVFPTVQMSHRSTYRTIPEQPDQSRSSPVYPEPLPNHFRSLRSKLDLGCFVEDRKKFLSCQKLFSTVAVQTEQCDQPGTSVRSSRLTPNCIPITKMDRTTVIIFESGTGSGARSDMWERGIKAKEVFFMKKR